MHTLRSIRCLHFIIRLLILTYTNENKYNLKSGLDIFNTAFYSEGWTVLSIL